MYNNTGKQITIGLVTIVTGYKTAVCTQLQPLLIL